MVNKQTLQLKPIYSGDEIVIIRTSKLSYIDETYFENVMGEDIKNKKYQTYGVQLNAIRGDWILNEEIGRQFLQAMLWKKNRDVFTTSYMKIVIKFLYDAYSYRIIIFLLPPYLAHLIAINLQIYYNEFMRSLREKMEHENSDDLEDYKAAYAKALIASNLIIVVCGGINILNTLVFIMQTKYLGTNAFTRIWS